MAEKNEGPIRIPLDSVSFLFNALAFPTISSKSLKFQSVLFSIPTAPTSFLISLYRTWVDREAANICLHPERS